MEEGPAISRRAVIRGAALTGAVGAVLGLRHVEMAPPWRAQSAVLTPSFTKAIHRRADQLALRLEFYNLQLPKKGQVGPGDPQQARLVKIEPGANSFIVVDFGPQHLAEHAYREPLDGEIMQAPVPSMLAGSSRLAFHADDTPIAYTFGALLAWKDLLPSLVPHATGAAEVREPEPTETALEVPWKMVLSPDQTSAWTHPMTPSLGPSGRAGLWHARLEVPSAPPNTTQALARVVWTPDLLHNNPADPPVPGATSLRPDQRRDLVRLTAKWDQKTGAKAYVPQPIDVEQLGLSPLGAWLKSSGAWEIRPDGVDLMQWVHLATLGRDHFVRIVEAGRLFPLGHKVALIQLTQRKFETAQVPGGGTKPAAILRQKFFLVPREIVRTYHDGDIPFAPDGLREMPFKKVRVLTKVTPELARYETLAESGNVAEAEPGTRIPMPNPNFYYGRSAFWPRVGTPGKWADFLWQLEAEDYEGRIVRLAMPLVYVTETFGSSYHVENLAEYYELHAGAAERRTRSLGGQKVALARFSGGQPGETAYPLENFTFGANTFEIPNEERVFDFTPRMQRAGARLDAVDRISGGSGGPREIKLHPKWISDGDAGSGNPGRVFATLTSAATLSFKANSSGGVATPDMQINALSAITGPMDAKQVNTVAPAKFDPAEFFAGGSPMLLGTIPLTKILHAVDFPAPGSMTAQAAGLSPVPRLVTTEIVEGGQVVGAHSALVWDTDVDPIAGLFVDKMNGADARLRLAAQTRAYFDGRTPTTKVEGDLTNFTLEAVLGWHVMDLKFNRFGFVSIDGKKPDITVDIEDVEFAGALEFVNVLRNYVGGNGIGGGPAALATAGAATQESPANGGYVNVTPSGAQAGYNLTLPSVPCGVLLMENISFGARVDLFFDGQAMRMRFNFAERNRPFVLTVMCFGGGGSLAVTLGLDALELFEASLEFGAKLALDIGVASGSISAMAGVYLAIGDTDGNGTDDGARLTGYLRLNGELSILSIVRMAIEFYLAFTYIENPKSIYGEAKVTVEIEVLFFSASVTLGPIKKTFAGGENTQSPAAQVKAAQGKVAQAKALKPGSAITGDAPKSFADMTSAVQWADYTDMFAPAAF